MRRSWLCSIVSILVGSAAPTARAELVDIAWAPNGRFERQLTVAPRGFAEVCGPLKRGERVVWRYAAQGRLDFDIHYHVGPAVHTPTRRKGSTRARGRLAVASDQDYCWMWSNPGGTPVPLSVRLTR